MCPKVAKVDSVTSRLGKGRHVTTVACPWVSLSFPTTHPRTRKAYDILARLKNRNPIRPIMYPKLKKIFYHLEFYRKFERVPFKTWSTPCLKKIIYNQFNTFSIREAINKHGIYKSQHIIFRPNSYVEGKRKMYDIRTIHTTIRL